MISHCRVRGVATGCALAIGLLASASARADGSCDAKISGQLVAYERVADSVRVDKPGLARVYAQDGTEFTAGEALWMKGQLREVEAACARGETASARQRLHAVEQLVDTRRHQNL